MKRVFILLIIVFTVLACSEQNCKLVGSDYELPSDLALKYEHCENNIRRFGFGYSGVSRKERLVKLEILTDVLSVDFISLYQNGIDTIKVEFYLEDTSSTPFYSGFAIGPSNEQIKEDWKNKPEYLIKRSAMHSFSEEEVLKLEEIMQSICRTVIATKNPNLHLYKFDVDFYQLIKRLAEECKMDSVESRAMGMLRGVGFVLEDTVKFNKSLKLKVDSVYNALPSSMAPQLVSKWD